MYRHRYEMLELYINFDGWIVEIDLCEHILINGYTFFRFSLISTLHKLLSRSKTICYFQIYFEVEVIVSVSLCLLKEFKKWNRKQRDWACNWCVTRGQITKEKWQIIKLSYSYEQKCLT